MKSTMKNALSLAAILLTAASLLPAQTTGGAAPQAQTANPQSTASPQQPAGGPKVRAAKTTAEYDAFQAASNEQDLAKADKAATEFATRFTDSDLRSILFEQLMRRYQQANNADKTLEMAHKVLVLDADSVFALLMVSSVLAERSADTDPNLPQRRDEIMKDAGHAIQLMDSGAFKPAQFSAEQLNALKSMAYAAQGTVELTSKNDKAAEDLLRKATELDTMNPEPSVWLRLALAMDHQKKYADALIAANRAVGLSAGDADVLKLATQEQTRLKMLAATH
jgi:tetratricopeptide (TPR) repeat protein